jgi:hypothetical protein
VPATVTEAILMADEDLAGAEDVPVGAARGRVGHPLPVRCPHQLAQHGYQRNSGVPVLYD